MIFRQSSADRFARNRFLQQLKDDFAKIGGANCSRNRVNKEYTEMRNRCVVLCRKLPCVAVIAMFMALYANLRVVWILPRMRVSESLTQGMRMATYQFMTNAGDMSSMKLHRDLGIRQDTAWFMVQRLREVWQTLAGVDSMKGPVEVDETYMAGWKRASMQTRRIRV